ncbi:hypothetical protein DBR06_SOUSAS4210102 [Sousa chinensis]|nr:hypothetical protein DBR06_SOUSAS4210102 [Sousa chinensis]
MDVTRLLLATLLVCLCFLTAYSHLAPEEKPRDERSLRSNSSMNLLDFPSVSIVAQGPQRLVLLLLSLKHRTRNPKRSAEKKRKKKDLPSPRSLQAEVRTSGADVDCSGRPGVSPQKKASMKKVAQPRPPPPGPCVASRDSCKPPAPACCDPCAFCQCRFFRSACSCRVLNPTC